VRLAATKLSCTKRFGDIPEVDLFIESVQHADNKTSVPIEKEIEFVRAIATLFPNASNLRHLRDMELRVSRDSFDSSDR
jgi:hypothetical protein